VQPTLPQGLRAPRGDRCLVALGGPVRGDLRAEPDPVQQVRGAAQRAVHVEQPGDQRGDPGQRPPLVLVPAVGRRAEVQRSAQPGQLRVIQLARVPARAFGGQRRLAARAPGPPPLVCRLRADPQALRYLLQVHALLEHLRGLQPHLLTASPSLSGQPATIGIPHTSGVDPAETSITQARRV